MMGATIEKIIDQGKKSKKKVLDKPCCIDNIEEFGPTKHTLLEWRALKKMQSAKDKDTTYDEGDKDYVGGSCMLAF